MTNDIILLDFIFQLFVLLNPASSFPALVAAARKNQNIKFIAVSATVIAFLLAVVIIFTGPSLFSIYGISLDSFRIAGGLILLLLGIETVREQEDSNEHTQPEGTISIIASPLLTGPAVISFLTLKIYEYNQFIVLLNSFVAFALVGLIFFLFSVYFSKINTKLISLFSRILGLFLTAVAVEMIAKGIFGLIHSIS
jgi:multiple antibiotic resistance protein